MTYKKIIHIIKVKYLILGVSVILGFLTISSCSVSEDSGSVEAIYANDGSLTSEFLNAKLTINKEVFDEINENRMESRPEGKLFTINDVSREQDMLLINLSYSGGCKPLEFEIIWDGIVYVDEPCHINLLLINNENGDLCEAFITETIVVNLKELIGDVIYKDTCDYYLFSTFNFGENADVIIEAIN